MECPDCVGTGLRTGLSLGLDWRCGDVTRLAIVCERCGGRGHHESGHSEYLGLRRRSDVSRVFSTYFSFLNYARRKEGGTPYHEWYNDHGSQAFNPRPPEAEVCPYQWQIHASDILKLDNDDLRGVASRCNTGLKGRSEAVKCAFYGKKEICWSLFDDSNKYYSARAIIDRLGD